MKHTATLILACVSAAFAADGLDIYPENPHYWRFRGEPVLLLGGTSAPDPTFLDEGMFHNAALIPELEKLTAAGGNYVRNLMSLGGRPGTVRPFARKGDWYDLDRWNEEYWRRFETFLRETSSRGVVAHVEIWASFDYYRDGWKGSPFNPQNNVTYTAEQSGLPGDVPSHPGSVANSFFFSVPALKNQATVLKYQQRFVDRILAHTLKYDHVLYCMDNETRAAPEWGAYWANHVRSAAAKKGVKVHVTEMWGGHDLDEPRHGNTIEHPELYTFIEVSQNNHQKGQVHYEKLLGVRRRIASSPRPMNNVKIYGVDGGKYGTTQDAAERFWRNIFAGCASSRFHEKHLGSSAAALRMMRSARVVTSAFDLFKTRPHPDLLTGHVEDGAYCLADPGKEYAVYFPRTGKARLALEGSQEGALLRWYAIDSGAWKAERRVPGPTIELRTPGDGQWVAVLIVRNQSSVGGRSK